MPSEVRYIFFSRSEMLAAVREFRSRRGQPLAYGVVKLAEVVASPELTYRLAIVPHDGGPERKYLIDETELGAALVFFCLSRGIPLPASAPKSLRLGGEDLILEINRNTSRAQLERLLRAHTGLSWMRMVGASQAPRSTTPCLTEIDA